MGPAVDLSRLSIPMNARDAEPNARGAQGQAIEKTSVPKRTWWQAMLSVGRAASEEQARQQARGTQLSVDRHIEAGRLTANFVEIAKQCLELLDRQEHGTIDMVNRCMNDRKQLDALARHYGRVQTYKSVIAQRVDAFMDCLVQGADTEGGLGLPTLRVAESVGQRRTGGATVTSREIQDPIATANRLLGELRAQSEVIRGFEGLQELLLR